MSRKPKDTTTKSASPKSTRPNRNVVAIYVKADEGDPLAREAESYLRPNVQAAATIREYNIGRSDDDTTGPDINALVDELTKQSSLVKGGDLARAEAMLVAQVHTLDAIFGNLARRARKAEYMDNLDRYTRLALKAQSQCRATWETLALMKNPPPVAFVRQANIGQAVQVNNAAPSVSSRAGETENLPNKLSEASNELLPNTGASTVAGCVYPQLEAVGAFNGPEDAGR